MLFRLQGRREGAVAQPKDWFQFGPSDLRGSLSTSSSRQGMGKGTSRLSLGRPVWVCASAPRIAAQVPGS